MGRFLANISITVCFLYATQSAAQVEVYRSSFEGTDGGWTADADWDPIGDWQRGVPGVALANCSFQNQNGPPSGAFDGTEVWATRITECHSDPNGTSSLRQTFDFTSVGGGVLSWQQFVSILSSESLQVLVNGDVVYSVISENLVTPDWEPQSVDLSAYSGQASVEVVFSFFANASFNRPGWYIDNVVITSLVDPNTNDVGVLLADDVDPVTTVGNPIVYTLSAINHSDLDANNVIVTGSLHASTVFDAATSDPAVIHDGSSQGGDFQISLGIMAPFEFRRFDIGVTTTQLGIATLTASIAADEDDPNAANDSSIEQTSVELITDLTAQIDTDQDPLIDLAPFSYEVDVTNNGPSAANQVAFAVTLPTNVSFTSASNGVHDGSATGGMVTGIVPHIPIGATDRVTIQAVPVAGQTGDFTTTVVVSTTAPDENDPDASNNNAEVIVDQVPNADPFPYGIFTIGDEAPDKPGETFTFFQRPYSSANGEHWIFLAVAGGTSSSNDEIIVRVGPNGAETVIQEGSTPLPDGIGDVIKSMRSKIGINDSGCYVFRSGTDGASNLNDVIVTGCGTNVAGGDPISVVAREGNIIPGDPLGRAYSFTMDESNIDNAGTIRFTADTNGLPTTEDEFVFETPDNGMTVSMLLQEGVSIPTGQAAGATDPWGEWDSEFSNARSGLNVSSDGLKILLRGNTDSASDVDDILTLNNDVLVQQGVILDPLFVAPVLDVTASLVAANGDVFARGINVGAQQWVMRNGEILAKTGDPIFPGSPEQWIVGGSAQGFNNMNADANGNYLIGGSTNFSPNGVIVYYAATPSGAKSGSGTNGRVVARADDPVDSDQNGLFDDNDFILFFSADGSLLLADGTLVMKMFIGVPFPVGESATAGPGSSSGGPAIAGISVIVFGACCDSGTCQDEVLQDACRGEFHLGKDCDEIVCGSLGACCFEDDSCSENTERDECENNLGGIHFPGQSCSQACGRGACCEVDNPSGSPDGPFVTNCLDDVAGPDCALPDDYKGDGSTCATVDCGGACCLPSTESGGGCVDDTTPALCEVPIVGLGGVYQGDGTQCNALVCSANGGACCLGGDACAVTTRGACGLVGGSYLGDDIPCANDPDDPDCPRSCFVDADCIDSDPCTVDRCVTGDDDSYCVNKDKDCNDNVSCTADSCDPTSGNCTNVPDDNACDDGEKCTTDTCDPQSGCDNVPRECDDGIGCTDDACNDATGECDFTPNPALCPDDGVFCNGREFCDASLDCSITAPPCVPDLLCDEDNDRCVECLTDTDCDDGVGCTDDTCVSGVCQRLPNDAHCPDDGRFCNGTEKCDAQDDCVSTGDPCAPPRPLCDEAADRCVECFTSTECDDGDPCTDDSCLPLGDCLHVFTDCNDGNACTFDVCDQHTGCDNSQPVVCEDFNTCTEDTCDPLTGCKFDPICGACCFPDGSCEQGLSPIGCGDQGGSYQGDRTTCTPNLCKGACCALGQGCIDDAAPQDCDPGEFLGLGSTCDNADCGACCLLGSDEITSCVDGFTSNSCSGTDLAYAGAGSSCANGACEGACCIEDQGCFEPMFIQDCDDLGGTFQGIGSTCSTADCGACCSLSVSGEPCKDGVSAAACSGALDVFQGPGTFCSQGLCEGACCLLDTGCVDDATFQDCAGANGEFFGIGSVCAGADCGACCLNDPSPLENCVDGLTQSDCEAFNQGAFQGSETTCVASDCGECNPPSPGEIDVCDDGLFCNGFEFCSGTFGDCQPGTPPCLPGEECVEATDSCRKSADFDGDGDTDDKDYREFRSCLGQPPVGVCAQADLNDDGTIDMQDVAEFQIRYTGP